MRSLKDPRRKPRNTKVSELYIKDKSKHHKRTSKATKSTPSSPLGGTPRIERARNICESHSEAMRKKSQVNPGLDASRYEIRVSTSNMFAHLEHCLEPRRPKIPGSRSVPLTPLALGDASLGKTPKEREAKVAVLFNRNQIQNGPKNTSASKKPKEEGDYPQGEWALVTRRSKKRDSPAKPARVYAYWTSCGHGDGSESARRDPGREVEKEEEGKQTSEPCPEFNSG